MLSQGFSWEIYLILYLASSIVFNQSFRVIMKAAKNVGAAVVVMQLFAVVVSFLLTPFFEWRFPSDIRVYLLLALATIFYAILDRAQGTARKHLDVSVTMVVGQISKVFLIGVGVLLYHETLGLGKIIGSILIIFSVFILSYKKGKFELNRYVLLSILGRLSFAVAVTIDVGISRQFNFMFYIALTYLLPAIYIFLGQRFSLADLRSEFTDLNKKLAVVSSMSWVGVIVFYIWALQNGEFTVVAPLAGSSVLLNSTAAYFILKERSDFSRNVLAALVVMLGIYFVT